MNAWNKKKLSHSSFTRVAREIVYTSQSQFCKSSTSDVRDK